MTIQFGREICGDLHASNAREWLVTNGIGGYAAGTVSGVLTRCYHGLLIAALRPPLERTLLLSKLDETVAYGGQTFAIASNRWTSGSVAPEGYRLIESFQLQGGIPRWTYACADALLEKRIWMQPGSNTSYVQYGLLRGSEPAALTIKALVNYRDHNGNSRSNDWQMQVMAEDQGVSVLATPEAVPFYLLASQGDFNSAHDWYLGFDLAQERFRGLVDQEDHLHVATYTVQLAPGETCT
ncbi:MAG: glycogen debranching enzyme N-terminal domain-containing protein, partial [Cyanobacteria bacterium P01_F01_bin.42]